MNNPPRARRCSSTTPPTTTPEPTPAAEMFLLGYQAAARDILALLSDDEHDVLKQLVRARIE